MTLQERYEFNAELMRYKIVEVRNGEETDHATGFTSRGHAFASATNRAANMRLWTGEPRKQAPDSLALRTDDGKPVKDYPDDDPWLSCAPPA